MNTIKKRRKGGFIALMTIIIIASVSLIMALNTSLLGLGELDLGYTAQRGGEVFAIADGCMEEAFMRLRLDSNYQGGNISMSEGSCSIVVLADGSSRDISVTANTTDNYFKEIEATVTLTTDTVSKIIINSWGK